jgi:hypothetical protein
MHRLLVATGLLAACQGDPHLGSEDVVGGGEELGYDAAGYLLVGDSWDTLEAPWCGAVLLSPTVAVSAAHCFGAGPLGEGLPAPTHAGISFGAIGSGEIVRVGSPVIVPDSDLAILPLLARVDDRAPAVIVEPKVDDRGSPTLVDGFDGPGVPQSFAGRTHRVGDGWRVVASMAGADADAGDRVTMDGGAIALSSETGNVRIAKDFGRDLAGATLRIHATYLGTWRPGEPDAPTIEVPTGGWKSTATMDGLATFTADLGPGSTVSLLFSAPAASDTLRIDDVSIWMPTACDATARLVGYGIENAERSEAGDRKSARVCVTDVGGGYLKAKGFDGSSCWGDSGSPLFVDGTDQVVGLTSFVDPLNACYVGAAGWFVDLASHREALARFLD